MSLRSEIYQQPQVLQRFLRDQRDAATEIAAAIEARGVRSIVVAARGSSDNAALYGKYLWGWMNRVQVALATPSLFTIYYTPPRLEGALVVGISQSGESPDIVRVVEEGRLQGALTLAITNEPRSPLATAAELVLETLAGPEHAVAATKTYTSQLAAIALLGASGAGNARLVEELGRVPGLVEQALGLDDAVAEAAHEYRDLERCVVLGRGFNYATAHEWSLKLKEMTYAVAEPYSPADFRHGPLAMVSADFPVLAVAPGGAAFASMLPLLETLAGERRARLLVLSDEAEALSLATTPIGLPAGVPEWLSPLVSIVPAQLFCYHLTRALGHDPEQPRGLAKVTRTL